MKSSSNKKFYIGILVGFVLALSLILFSVIKVYDIGFSNSSADAAKPQKKDKFKVPDPWVCPEGFLRIYDKCYSFF